MILFQNQGDFIRQNLTKEIPILSWEKNYIANAI